MSAEKTFLLYRPERLLESILKYLAIINLDVKPQVSMTISRTAPLFSHETKANEPVMSKPYWLSIIVTTRPIISKSFNSQSKAIPTPETRTRCIGIRVNSLILTLPSI